MSKRPTVSLQMIVKDEFEPAKRLVSDAVEFFDEINLTVSNKPTANKLAKFFSETVKIKVIWREWTDRFDQARNANLEMCTTDYFFWLDADDEFDFEVIPQLLDIAIKNNVDALFLPYNYAQDDEGNCITMHWRERLIRTDRGFTWRGWVHETCLSDIPYQSHKVDIPVIHHTTPGHDQDSVLRNHDILIKAYEDEKDPRYLHYLGMSYFTFGDYEKAVELLSEYLQVGGSIEDSYRALSVISECAYYLGRHDMALEYATKCATLKPEYPMAFFLLAQYEADQGNWKEALEWARVSMTKPDPDSLSVYDPTARDRAVLLGAQACFMLTNYNDALGWLRKIPKNKNALDLMPDFQEEADAETFTKVLPKMRKFFNSDSDLWTALCKDMKYDTRLLPLRQMVNPPKTWDDKSLVIFCGQGFEEWGPHTADQGMGGSEEAVLYLAPELSKLGYHVTVYAEADMVQNEGTTSAVHWKPWKEIDTRDFFNIFVSWRAPQYLEKITAKVKIADIHDVLPTAIMKNYPDVTYFVKSKYHRDLAPDVPDEKMKIIGNGIKKEQFA